MVEVVPPASHEQLSVSQENLQNNVNRNQGQLRAVKHRAKVIAAAYVAVDKTISKSPSSDESDKEERFVIGVAEVGYDATKDVLVCSTGHSTHKQLRPCPKPYPCCGVCHLFDVKDTDSFSSKPVAFN